MTSSSGDSESQYVDALPGTMARGRAAGINPGNRFETVRLHVLGDHIDAERAEHPDGLQVATEMLPDASRSVINYVNSPDLGFHWSINPYRGCEHGCVYCYARPTHETLGFSSGLDFETKIMVKHDAAAIVRRELASPRWKPEPIMISGVTDPYQPLESRLRITRSILEVLAECRQPASLITKNRLITRDIDLLSELARHHAVRVAISLTTLNRGLARAMEPRTSTPVDRLRAMRELSDAGIPVAVMTAPIIPGLNDHEIPRLLEAASQHGAVSAGWVMLRLPHQVKAVFLNWLQRSVPDRAARIEQAIRSTREGGLYDSNWSIRQRGQGPLAQQIRSTFEVFSHRHGLDGRLDDLSGDSFRRPMLDGQLGLFQS
jgi:DNA repair photolyase